MFTGGTTARSLLSRRRPRLPSDKTGCSESSRTHRSALALIPQPCQDKDSRPSRASSSVRSLDIVSEDPLGPETGGWGGGVLFTQGSVAAQKCSIGLGCGDLGGRVKAGGSRSGRVDAEAQLRA